jgi:uncharacterized protein
MCIVTREVKDEAELIRFVRSPEGVAVPDLARKLPGRGVWVSLSRPVLAEAIRKKLFSKGFAEATTIPPDLARMVANCSASRCCRCSRSKKAGESVAGFMKVEEMLGRGRARLLFHASEASPGRQPQAGQAGCSPAWNRIVIFHSDELDLAFGRSNVVHAAVAKGGLAEKLVLGRAPDRDV